MGYNNNHAASALFLAALLLFAASTQAQVVTVRGLTVSGSLCCTPTGNCPGQGVNGAVASLNCNILGASVVVGRNTTVNGNFSITVPALAGLILGQSTVPCVVSVQLPLSSLICPVLSTVNTTAGTILASAIQIVGTVVSPILGLVENGILVGGFVTVSTA